MSSYQTQKQLYTHRLILRRCLRCGDKLYGSNLSVLIRPRFKHCRECRDKDSARKRSKNGYKKRGTT